MDSGYLIQRQEQYLRFYFFCYFFVIFYINQGLRKIRDMFMLNLEGFNLFNMFDRRQREHIQSQPKPFF